MGSISQQLSTNGANHVLPGHLLEHVLEVVAVGSDMMVLKLMVLMESLFLDASIAELLHIPQRIVVHQVEIKALLKKEIGKLIELAWTRPRKMDL